MRNFYANIGTLPIQFSYNVDVLTSRVTTVNPSCNVAFFKASLHTFYLIFNDTFAFLITAFEVYGDQLQTVPRLKYLGRILTEGDDNWPAVAGNLVKARKSWGRLQGILSREGATKRVSGNFFKAVVQQVLLFGAKTWVLSPRMERALSAFIHGAARRITGRQPQRWWDGK